MVYGIAHLQIMVKIILNIGDRVVLRGASYRRNSEIGLKLKKNKKTVP